MLFLTKIFGDSDNKFLKKIKPVIEKINSLEPQFEKINDENLKEKTKEFKERLKQGECLDDILPEAFALVREAAKRTLGQRHFDVQLLGGIVLHQGKIAEMKTGEGKTLVATLPAYLNALSGKGVHIVTVNDYLAKRDTNWMGPVYELLGLKIGCITHENAYLFESKVKDKNEVSIEMENLKEISRQEAYGADITYGTNNEFGFDYLRDNLVQDVSQFVQRKHYFTIIDEVDSILIDEARTPLIISAPDVGATEMYAKFSRIVPQLKENIDFNIDEKMRSATLTEEGMLKIEKILGFNIWQEQGIRYVHHLEQALRAHTLFKKDRDYIVKDGQAVIVDEFTGRLMFGRRYSGGLHQAIEAKEKVKIQEESRTLASITFQNYFRLYEKLAGMTGTAATSAEEFHKVYNLEVVIAPTHKPMIRLDLGDKVYKTEKGKFMAVVQEIKERHQKDQPALVGTVSIEKNEFLSALLKKQGIPHQVLNAKNHESEAQIIARAGEKGAVTVATNMAGRGVDIKLEEGVVKLGGLHIIGTERHEARRIDNQLRGRSGRQGDPGSSQFFVSLEDDLMRIFGGERIKNMMEILKVPEEQSIENKMLSRAIEAAQAKIEGFNFDARKHILEYDDVMNRQRKTIYKMRRDVLTAGREDIEPQNSKLHLKIQNLKEHILEIIKKEIERIIMFHTHFESPENWNLKEICEIINAIFPLSENERNFIKEAKDKKEIIKYLIEAAERCYREKETQIGSENMRQIEKIAMLRTIDVLWMEHLDNMEHLKDSVRLRAYGHLDPLVEYKNEGHRLFQKLLENIESNAVEMIYKVSLAPISEQNVIARKSEATTKQSSKAQVSSYKKVGRNDPCPCGATKPDGTPKKYKHCHGR